MAKKYYLETEEFHTNKTWLVLRYFDPAERKRLMKFMASPYFNQSRTMTKLCELLLRLIDQGKPGFDRREIWCKLFPNEEYDDVNFRKYCSDLLKFLETFMAQESIAKDGTRQGIDTLEFIVSRNVEPLYNSAFRQIRADMDKHTYRSLDYYRKQYEIEKQHYLMMDYDQKLNLRANIEEISRNLDLYYWIEKLKLYIATLSHRKTGNFEYNLSFTSEMLQYLGSYPIEEVPELAIYYYSFLTLYNEENTEHYFDLRRMLDHYSELMPREEAVEIFDSALHYCIGRINKGDRNFLEQYFALSDIALSQGVFLQKGEIATWRYNNMVGAALRLGKLDWAEEFVNKYRQYLNLATRDNIYAFNLARVYRYQKKYKEVLLLLQSVEYEDIIQNLISKAILIIVYYELDEYTSLDSFLDSFRAFLNRNKKQISHQHKILHLNLIKFTRRLTRLLPGDKTAVAKLREDIVRERASTVNHEWLLEKLDEL